MLGLVAAGVLGVGAYYLFLVRTLDAGLACNYREVEAALSPDGKMKAALVDPGCGGATGPSETWVVVSPAHLEPDYDKDRVAILEDGTGAISWTDEALVVRPGTAKLTEKKPSRWGQPVSYQP